ncbi:predicted protein [Naegleria gruberi]|uniref:Predicted protein n=1 Tax=Naegleria gruberi TaxID=5762 RepID=D2VB99_NAEGR|nr:uncharacterized protein NAEGRDRAFT_66141 [Naegleria gruberi]EFC45871.1 predicted protein [Naegleria gruberi]|eukprot:XP_002678615.1 predicted protein [Naegleria gruberi strain NEG-M]
MSQVAVVNKEEFLSHFSSCSEQDEKQLPIELSLHLKDISFLSDYSLPTNIFPNILFKSNDGVVGTKKNNQEYGIQYNFLLDAEEDEQSSRDEYWKHSHQSLFSLNWNSKVDHTDNFYSLMQYYYGPFKMLVFLLGLVVMNAICMVALVKFSWVGDFMENSVFNSITNRALNEMNLKGDISQMGTMDFFISFLRNSTALSSVFYIMVFFFSFTVFLLALSFFEYYWILRYIQRETRKNLEKYRNKQDIHEDYFSTEYLIIDKSWKNSEETVFNKLPQIVHGHIKYLEYEIQQDGSVEKLAISKFILEKLIFCSGSTKRNLTNAARVIEITDFSLKKHINIAKDEWVDPNFHVALQLFEVTIKDLLKETNASAIIIKISSLQYGLIRLCDKMKFTLVHEEKSNEFPIINYYYVLESNKLL